MSNYRFIIRFHNQQTKQLTAHVCAGFFLPKFLRHSALKSVKNPIFSQNFSRNSENFSKNSDLKNCLCSKICLKTQFFGKLRANFGKTEQNFPKTEFQKRKN